MTKKRTLTESPPQKNREQGVKTQQKNGKEEIMLTGSTNTSDKALRTRAPQPKKPMKKWKDKDERSEYCGEKPTRLGKICGEENKG